MNNGDSIVECHVLFRQWLIIKFHEIILNVYIAIHKEIRQTNHHSENGLIHLRLW